MSDNRIEDRKYSDGYSSASTKGRGNTMKSRIKRGDFMGETKSFEKIAPRTHRGSRKG